MLFEQIKEINDWYIFSIVSFPIVGYRIFSIQRIPTFLVQFRNQTGSFRKVSLPLNTTVSASGPSILISTLSQKLYSQAMLATTTGCAHNESVSHHVLGSKFCESYVQKEASIFTYLAPICIQPFNYLCVYFTTQLM